LLKQLVSDSIRQRFHGEETKTWERATNRRGERRRGQLNPGLEERFDSRSKASKLDHPEVAVAGSLVSLIYLAEIWWRAVSRRAVTAGGHELAMSQRRLRIGRNP